MSAIVLDTPEQIDRFCLASLRGRLKMEKVGMKCKGRSAKSIVSGMFGVSNRTPIDTLISLVQKRLDETK